MGDNHDLELFGKAAPAVKQGEVVDASEFADDDEEDILVQDLLDAASLLRKSMHLLDCFSNPDLCPDLTSRERGVMSKLSTEIDTFLEGIEGSGISVENVDQVAGE
jgi:hypothetical protein